MTAFEPVSKFAFVPSGRTIFVANCDVISIVSFWLEHTFANTGLMRSSSVLRHVIGFTDDGGVWKKKDRELRTRRVT